MPDEVIIVEAMKQYPDSLNNFSVFDWLSVPSNVALINEHNDVALFERNPDNPFSVFGHYFFWSRGKQALKAGNEFIEEIFTGPYDVEIIVGLTPVEHKAALWMNKKLGFKEVDEVVFSGDSYKFVVLSYDSWKEAVNG